MREERASGVILHNWSSLHPAHDSVCLLSAQNTASGTVDCCLFISFRLFSVSLIKMRRSDCGGKKREKKTL